VTSAGGRAAGLSALVSARGGDWTQALVHLCATTGSFEVELAGPFPFGGGPWSLSGGGGGGEPALLLLAGGTGVTGWLPALAAAASEGRPCRLVWCVQNEADYHALADRLPRNGGVEVTVYITRAAAAAAVEAGRGGGGIARSGGDERAWGSTRAAHSSAGSLVSASLAATLVGLAAGQWGWAYVAEALELPLDAGWLHHSLVGYTLSRRCLPVLLIVASIAATTAVCSRAFGFAAGRCQPCDLELAPVSPRRHDPLLAASRQRQRGGFAPAGGPAGDEAGQRVCAGRPDFDALVRAAAAGLEAKRLVVAACGPASMVEGARSAVAKIRAECRGEVRFEFSGGDSRW